MELEATDIDKLNSSTLYAIAAPIATGILVYGYSRMREEGGAASHFAHALS